MTKNKLVMTAFIFIARKPKEPFNILGELLKKKYNRNKEVTEQKNLRSMWLSLFI